MYCFDSTINLHNPVKMKGVPRLILSSLLACLIKQDPVGAASISERPIHGGLLERWTTSRTVVPQLGSILAPYQKNKALNLSG
jgi:hypothetical protein